MPEILSDALARLADPLFATPFMTGLAFAILLPLCGAYLRLRDEWLAALAFAQTAAAGALLAMLAGLPLPVGGIAAASAAAGLKSVFDDATRGLQGAAYALLLLAGWSVSVLLVANLPLAERLGHALFDGQLYFVDRSHLLGALLMLALAGGALHRLSPALLLSHLFPEFFRARGRSARRVHFAFDLLVATALALATMSLGVMAAFALVFVPPLVAWQAAGNWRRSLLLAGVIGAAAHLLAFVLAIVGDQPYGPMLALVLVLLGAAAAPMRGLHRPR
jgi:zinc/manganese transport system permease protein